MHMIRTFLGVALLGVFAAACSEQKSPTAPSVEEPAPSLNFNNGPPHPGNSVVFRGEVPVLWIGTDPARDLLSVNGSVALDPSQSFFCGGAPDFDIFEFQDVLTKGGVPSHGVIENPRQHIYVGIDNFWSQPTFCDALMQPRVAAGIGDYFRVNTSCSGIAPCDNGAKTEGWTAHGTLTDLVNGGLVQYSEEQRAVWNPQTRALKILVENIRLTPIGGP